MFDVTRRLDVYLRKNVRYEVKLNAKFTCYVYVYDYVFVWINDPS